MALPIDVTNPGSVNVANQGYDFLPTPDQAVKVQVPSSNGNPNVVNVVNQGFNGLPKNVFPGVVF